MTAEPEGRGVQARPPRRPLWQEVFLALRILALVFSALVVVSSLAVPLSFTGRSFVILQFVLLFAACGLWRRGQLPLLLIAIVISVGISLFGGRLPESPIDGAAWRTPGIGAFLSLASLVPEEDGIFVATKLFSAVGEITAREATGLWPKLVEAYRSMREERGQFPSPLIATFLGLESPSAFDTIAFRSKNPREPRRALVFLHGFGGNWSLLCYLVSRAASPLGLDTFCPSTGPLGPWGNESGGDILAQTFAHLEQEGYREVFVSGLSAGAIGLGERAASLPKSVRGLVYLFGGHPDGKRSTLPALYIYGDADERIPAKLMEAFIRQHAATGGGNLSITKVAGDHLALLKAQEEVLQPFRDWLQKQLEGQT